jgi:hypothetical protein
MVYFVLLALLMVIYSICAMLADVWRAYREKKRSLATAVAISCIAAGILEVPATVYAQREASVFQEPLEVAGIVLLFWAGILGAVGLIWDRQLAKRRQPHGEGQSQDSPTDRKKEPD